MRDPTVAGSCLAPLRCSRAARFHEEFTMPQIRVTGKSTPKAAISRADTAAALDMLPTKFSQKVASRGFVKGVSH